MNISLIMLEKAKMVLVKIMTNFYYFNATSIGHKKPYAYLV